jgi:hemerythrin superfamily protein
MKEPAMPKTMNALELLRKDHRTVLMLLRKFEKSSDEREQHELCDEIIDELDAHTALEEDCFYPYVRESTDRLDLIEEATIEHGTAKDLMRELGGRNEDPARFHALVKVLGEYVTMHVREEEERIFPLVEKLGIDLDALGMELAERKGMPVDGDSGHDALRKRSAPHRGERAQGGRHGAPAHAHDTNDSNPARTQHDKAAHGSDSTRDDEKFASEHGDELSRSTQHAKWIHSTGEHEDHAGQTLATRNPDVIRQWAEERKAQPATTPGGDTQRPRVLRFDFPGYERELQPVSWDAWLRTFDERELVFLYQEHMKAGNQSNFFRLDSPHREEG